MSNTTKQPLQVLIIEDVEDDAILLAYELERNGFDPIWQRADTLAATEAALRRQKWDMIICDYNMPRFNISAALDLVNMLALDVPFIVVSGAVEEDVGVEAMKAGAHDYLPKNRLTRLVPAIKRELRVAAVRRERQRAKQALSDSERLLRAVVEGTTDAVYVKDRQGCYLMINTAGARFLGKSVDEVLGKDDTELFSAETAKAIMEGDRRIMETGEVQTYEDVGRAAGATRIYLSTKGPYRDAGSVIGVVGISRDITSRKRGEQRLAAEHAVTHALAKAANLEEAVPQILQAICQSADWDLGAFWRLDPSGQKLRCVHLWHKANIQASKFEAASRQAVFVKNVGLPGRALASGRLVWISDMESEADLPRAPIAAQEGFHCAVALPLRIGEATLGVIEFFSAEIREPDRELFKMMAAIGSQISQFLERRQAQMALHERDSELRLARNVQQGLLPKTPPLIAGFDIAGASHPAQETGGDYFDFISMPDGAWGLAVGDASGHGIGAALLMAQTRACLRLLSLIHTNPADILRLTNDLLLQDADSVHFVTLLLARLDPDARTLVYSNAGHWPGFLLSAQGEPREVFPSTSVPLGAARNREFPNGPPVTMAPGELLFMFSDGVTEATSADGLQFGIERTLAVIRAHRRDPSNDILSALWREVRAWSPDAPADDMTAIVVKASPEE